MALIDPGTPAPPLRLPDSNGRMHDLGDHHGHAVVVYFYPKDDTSGCTKEACAFRDQRPEFDRLRAVVFGISPDDRTSHARFAEKYGLNFTLLADRPGDDGTPPACSTWGVWQPKSMYGRTYPGVVRTTYLIDALGNVARRWDKVKVPGHAEEVLEAVRSLG